MMGKLQVVILYLILQMGYIITSLSLQCDVVYLQQNRSSTYFHAMSVTRNNGLWKSQSIQSMYDVGHNQTFSTCAIENDNNLLCIKRKEKSISRIHKINGSDKNVSMISEMRKGVSTDTKIVYDDVHEVLFWYDLHFNKLVMSSLNKPDIVPYTLKMTVDIKEFIIASNKGVIIYIEQGHDFKIWQSTMLGDNKRTIVYKAVLQPTSLDIDEIEERVYWYDLKKRTIESCNYDGSDRNVIVAVEKPLQGVQHLKGNTLIAYSESEILVVDFSSENVKLNLLIDHIRIHSVLVLRNDTQRSDKCRNLGCEHYCVTKQDIERCICTNGYILHPDGKQCLAPKDYVNQLVFTIIDRTLCYRSIQFLAGINGPKTCIDDYKNVSSIFVDVVRRVVYFTANGEAENAVFTMDVDTMKGEKILDNRSEVKGLVYNKDLNVVYALVDKRLIALNSTTTYEIRCYIDDAKFLTFSNEKRMLFWYKPQTGIFTCLPSSGKVTYLVAAMNVRSMIFNHINERLYWTTDSGIWSIYVNGSDFLVEIVLDMSTIILTHYQNLFYMRRQVDGNVIQAYDWRRKTFEFEINTSENDTITEMVVMDSDTTSQVHDKCQENNGGCEHICYVDDDGAEMCSCKPGFRLENMTNSCIHDEQNDDYLLVADDGNEAIFQVGISSYNITSVLDGSHVLDMDLDPHEMKMYFVAQDNSFLSSLKIDTGEISTSQLKGFVPRKLSYDAQREMLLLSAFNGSTTNLYVVKITNISDIHQIDSNLEVSSITTSIKHGFVFTSRSGPNGQIFKHDYLRMLKMDFFVPNVRSPTGLTVDEAEDELYWIEDESNACFKSSFAPEPRVSRVYYNEDIYPKDIAVDDNFIYILGRNARYIIKLKKTQTASIEKIPLSPELGLIRSILVYNKDFCPSISTSGNFRINSNCSFLTGDVCEYVCEGQRNDSNIDGIAACSENKEWLTMSDNPGNIKTKCKIEVKTTTVEEIGRGDRNNTVEMVKKDEKNNEAIVLGVLFALTLFGFITMLVLFIRKRMTLEKGIIIDHVANRAYTTTRNMNEI